MYLHTWGCAYQNTCILRRVHHTWGCVYRTRVLGGIHYRECTFIPGSVHTKMHVWGSTSTIGSVPSYLGVCIPRCMSRRAHPLQGVYLHTWGCAYQDACVYGGGSTTGGVPSYLGVCLQDTRTGGHPLQGVYLHIWGCADQDVCLGGASTTGCVPSYLWVWIPGCMCTGGHALQGVYLHTCWCAYQGMYIRSCLATTSQKYLVA